jgi:hypothetical protein
LYLRPREGGAVSHSLPLVSGTPKVKRWDRTELALFKELYITGCSQCWAGVGGGEAGWSYSHVLAKIWGFSNGSQ